MKCLLVEKKPIACESSASGKEIRAGYESSNGGKKAN